MNKFWLAAFTLLQRETVRFLRERHRIIGALGTPIVFWILIGSGIGRSFRAPGAMTSNGSAVNYLQYFFPGTIVMILLFTAIFSTISIIEDRSEGFLQGVLASPAPRGAMVLGKMLGGTLLATGQGICLLILFPLLGIHLAIGAILLTLLTMLLISFGLTGLGFWIAWRLDSSQGFHAIMNLFLIPMWFLSGSLFPLAGAPTWLQWIMRLNPLTYGVAIFHQLFFHSSAAAGHMPSPAICLLIIAVFSAGTYALSMRAVEKS
jgi:ABC-2 type transport system permease protein